MDFKLFDDSLQILGIKPETPDDKIYLFTQPLRSGGGEPNTTDISLFLYPKGTLATDLVLCDNFTPSCLCGTFFFGEGDLFDISSVHKPILRANWISAGSKYRIYMRGLSLYGHKTRYTKWTPLADCELKGGNGYSYILISTINGQTRGVQFLDPIRIGCTGYKEIDFISDGPFSSQRIKQAAAGFVFLFFEYFKYAPKALTPTAGLTNPSTPPPSAARTQPLRGWSGYVGR